MAPYFSRVMQNAVVEEAPHHSASAAFVRAAKELGLPEIDFQKQIAEGVGYIPLNARGLAAILIHHLPASSFRLATPSGDLDRGTGHANPDRER